MLLYPFLDVSPCSYLPLLWRPVRERRFSNFSCPAKCSKPALWVLAGFGFLTNNAVHFRPHLPLGKNMFPGPSIFWKRNRNHQAQQPFV